MRDQYTIEGLQSAFVACARVAIDASCDTVMKHGDMSEEERHIAASRLGTKIYNQLEEHMPVLLMQEIARKESRQRK